MKVVASVGRLPERRRGLGIVIGTYLAPTAPVAPSRIGMESAIRRISVRRVLLRLTGMTEQPMHRVEVSLVGPGPVRDMWSVRSESVAWGSMVRSSGCVVFRRFQPFLEALRGHEVISLESTSAACEGAK